MQPGLHRVQGQEPEGPLPPGAGAVVRRLRVALEEAVEDDLVTVLVGVDEVQHERRIGLEPTQFARAAPTRDDPDAGRDVPVEARQEVALREQTGVPEEGEVTEDRVVLRVGHVVRHPRPGQRDVDIVLQLAAGTE